KKIEFNLRKDARGLPQFVGPNSRTLPARPTEIIIREDGEESHFKPDREAQKRDPNRTLTYRDEKGRVMQEGYLGELVPEKQTGRTIIYLSLNLLHGVVWFVCLWPLMRFSLGQALLISVGCWLTMTLFVLPPILTQAGKVAQAKPTEARRESPNESPRAS